MYRDHRQQGSTVPLIPWSIIVEVIWSRDRSWEKLAVTCIIMYLCVFSWGLCKICQLRTSLLLVASVSACILWFLERVMSWEPMKPIRFRCLYQAISSHQGCRQMSKEPRLRKGLSNFEDPCRTCLFAFTVDVSNAVGFHFLFLFSFPPSTLWESVFPLFALLILYLSLAIRSGMQVFKQYQFALTVTVRPMQTLRTETSKAAVLDALLQVILEGW